MLAGLTAGSMSMAAGEYVSVRSQADTEQADLARERAELKTQNKAERASLAKQVADHSGRRGVRCQLRPLSLERLLRSSSFWENWRARAAPAYRQAQPASRSGRACHGGDRGHRGAVRNRRLTGFGRKRGPAKPPRALYAAGRWVLLPLSNS